MKEKIGGTTPDLQGMMKSIKNGITNTFSFPEAIDQALAGLSRLRLQVAYDSLEGKHIQIKELGIDLEVLNGTPVLTDKGAVDVTPTLTMDNSSEGGRLDTTSSGVDVVVLARTLNAPNANFLKAGIERGISGSREIGGAASNDHVGSSLGGFYTQFSGEDRELERVYARTSATSSSGINIMLSGDSGMVDKHGSSLSDEDVDIAYLSADPVVTGIGIGREDNKRNGERFIVPNSSNYSQVFGLIADFDVRFENGDHAEVYYIEVDVNAVQEVGSTDWTITPRLDFVGGDNQWAQMDPDRSYVSFIWVGIPHENEESQGSRRGRKS